MQRLNELGRSTVRVVSWAAAATFCELRGRLKSMGGGAGGRRMRVVESLALGGKRHLLLVSCDAQEYLVGTGPESVQTIVLRQPVAVEARSKAEDAAAVAVEAPARTGSRQAWPEASRTGFDQTALGAARVRGTLREEAVPRPWLVPAGLQAAHANHIEDAASSKKRELWQ